VKQFPNIALPPQSWDAGSGKTQAAEAGQRQNGTERNREKTMSRRPTPYPGVLVVHTTPGTNPQYRKYKSSLPRLYFVPYCVC